ncbi:TatD family hydrolase [Buchnera aphidicola (Kurisakia onigurumii)]|uniref:TatD family hydrolase n=1 Tax=Buchnera aphidicola TaxID=9 RepID=UPI0031B6925D
MILIDSHCHLHHLKKQKIKNCEIKKIIQEANKKNVKFFLNVSVSINDFHKMISKISDNKNIFYSCGIHPLYVKKNIFNISELKEILKIKNVIAVGETGLDFYKNTSNKLLQEKNFDMHINCSFETRKPIIIHSRNSSTEIIKHLNNNKNKLCSGVLHSFTGNLSFAKKLLDLGFYISFSGIITFKNSEYLRKILQYIPLDRLLIETDSPYLSPIPYRGKENKPIYLYQIAKCIASLKNICMEKLSDSIKKNFITLFNVTLKK